MGDGVENGRARWERAREQRARTGETDEDGRRTRTSAADKGRRGAGWVVARTGGEDKDRQPRRKSPPLIKPLCGPPTRAVVRQRPLPAHHQRASDSGCRRRTTNAAAIAEAIAAASLASEIAAAAASDFEWVDIDNNY